MICQEKAQWKNTQIHFVGYQNYRTSKFFSSSSLSVQKINVFIFKCIRIKIITGGNHDHFLDSYFGFTERKQTLLTMIERFNLVYLEHETYQLPPSLGSFTMFVSPYSPIHLGGAFMLTDMSEIWENVPCVDILVTHTPPFGFGDRIIRGNRHVGCEYLRKRMDTVIKPKVSVFGHIHEAHGYEFDENGVLYINACLSDHRYRPVNKPITFDLPFVSPQQEEEEEP